MRHTQWIRLCCLLLFILSVAYSLRETAAVQAQQDTEKIRHALTYFFPLITNAEQAVWVTAETVDATDPQATQVGRVATERTPTPTRTPIPTRSLDETPTFTPTPAHTATATNTPIPTATPSPMPTLTVTPGCDFCWAYWKIEMDFPYDRYTRAYVIRAIWTARYGYDWHVPVVTVTRTLECQSHGDLYVADIGRGVGEAIFDGHGDYITCSVPSMLAVTQAEAPNFARIIPDDKDTDSSQPPSPPVMPGPANWVAGLVTIAPERLKIGGENPIIVLEDRYENRRDLKYLQTYEQPGMIKSEFYLSQTPIASFPWQPTSVTTYFWAGHQLMRESMGRTWGDFLSSAWPALPLDPDDADVVHLVGPTEQQPSYVIGPYHEWQMSTDELTLYIGHDPEAGTYFHGSMEKVGVDPVKFGNG